jgi:hypothetical protein
MSTPVSSVATAPRPNTSIVWLPSCGTVPRLTGALPLAEEAFAYHGYRWALQEIADYAGRLLEGAPASEEAEHALTELRAYLPLPVESIAAETERALAVVRSAGAVLDDSRSPRTCRVATRSPW